MLDAWSFWPSNWCGLRVSETDVPSRGTRSGAGTFSCSWDFPLDQNEVTGCFIAGRQLTPHDRIPTVLKG
jgi:hypothetical protein